MDDLYLIAEVFDIHEIGGSVIVESISDFPEHFFELEKVFIDFFGKVKELEVEFVRKFGDKFVFKFRRFDSKEDVQFLLGKKLFLKKEKLFKLPENSYYIHDLMDCEVYLESMFFGKLIDVLNLPANDVYVVSKNSGAEIMIPAVEEFIEKINLDEKKIFLTNACRMLDED